ncbi:hypothetical protein ACLX1H_001041 [Fusarium chlamydosporum]
MDETRPSELFLGSLSPQKQEAARAIKEQAGRLDKVLSTIISQMNTHDEAWQGFLLVPDIVAAKEHLFPDHRATEATADCPLTEGSTNAITASTSVTTWSPPLLTLTWSPPNSTRTETRVLAAPPSKPKQTITTPTGDNTVPSSTTKTNGRIKDNEISGGSSVGTVVTAGPTKTISNAVTHSSKQAVPVPLPVNPKTMDDQTTKCTGACSNAFRLPNSDNSGMVEWARQHLRNSVKDVIEDVELLLLVMQANADMLLAKLGAERNHGTAILELTNKTLGIVAQLDDSTHADAITAKEDIPSPQKRSKDSSTTFDVAHDTIGLQLKRIQLLLESAQEANDLTTKVTTERIEVEEQVQKLKSRINGIEEEIKEWEELKFRVEKELWRILVLVRLAQLHVQGVGILREKHPGFFKDLRILAASGEHSE